MVRTIRHGEIIIAIIVPSTFSEHGVSFFTPDDFSQQLAFMKHPAGKLIAPHIHTQVKREVLYTKEVLVMRSGSMRVDLYTEEKVFLSSAILGPGDVILLAAGGHGFEVLEDAEFFEVKQGPYAGEDDKIRFEPANGTS